MFNNRCDQVQKLDYNKTIKYFKLSLIIKVMELNANTPALNFLSTPLVGKSTRSSYNKDLNNDKFRFLNRSSAFHQSSGRWNVKRSLTDKDHKRWYTRLYFKDWFHS